MSSALATIPSSSASSSMTSALSDGFMVKMVVVKFFARAIVRLIGVGNLVASITPAVITDHSLVFRIRNVNDSRRRSRRGRAQEVAERVPQTHQRVAVGAWGALNPHADNCKRAAVVDDKHVVQLATRACPEALQVAEVDPEAPVAVVIHAIGRPTPFL